ncbi:MAG: hypothetical protein HOM25_14720 [Rhodospirillaceae bacterium]|jgi:hypothetical protein|nr:hypothetical protein [Rhodospirillaceae bacterium]MBT5664046.1 hypothetical protein [Rhodospirillaceae bacterium]
MNFRRFTLSDLIHGLIWTVVFLLAFFMQVVPFLLILTLINISFGVSSTVMLIVIPVALFGMICLAAIVVERNRKKNWIKHLPPPPARQSTFVTMKEARANMVPHLRRGPFR